jgi:hypothetical protein
MVVSTFNFVNKYSLARLSIGCIYAIKYNCVQQDKILQVLLSQLGAKNYGIFND